MLQRCWCRNCWFYSEEPQSKALEVSNPSFWGILGAPNNLQNHNKNLLVGGRELVMLMVCSSFGLTLSITVLHTVVSWKPHLKQLHTEIVELILAILFKILDVLKSVIFREPNWCQPFPKVQCTDKSCCKLDPLQASGTAFPTRWTSYNTTSRT